MYALSFSLSPPLSSLSLSLSLSLSPLSLSVPSLSLCPLLSLSLPLSPTLSPCNGYAGIGGGHVLLQFDALYVTPKHGGGAGAVALVIPGGGGGSMAVVAQGMHVGRQGGQAPPHMYSVTCGVRGTMRCDLRQLRLTCLFSYLKVPAIHSL